MLSLPAVAAKVRLDWSGEGVVRRGRCGAIRGFAGKFWLPAGAFVMPGVRLALRIGGDAHFLVIWA